MDLKCWRPSITLPEHIPIEFRQGGIAFLCRSGPGGVARRAAKKPPYIGRDKVATYPSGVPEFNEIGLLVPSPEGTGGSEVLEAFHYIA